METPDQCAVLSRHARHSSLLVAGAEQDFDSPVAPEIRVAKCANLDLVVRHSGLGQTVSDGIDTKIAQVSIARIHVAIDSDILRLYFEFTVV